MHNVLECSSVEECLHISAKVDECLLNPDIYCAVQLYYQDEEVGRTTK